MNTDHLAALYNRLSNEKERLANAKSTKERELRKVWVAGIENEIVAEMKFLGMEKLPEISDDDLLNELMG